MRRHAFAMPSSTENRFPEPAAVIDPVIQCTTNFSGSKHAWKRTAEQSAAAKVHSFSFKHARALFAWAAAVGKERSDVE